MYNPLTGLNDNRVAVEKRQITDLEIKEVSLVKRGANRKRFLFWKSEHGDVIDLLNTLEAVEENYTVSAEESEHIEKALKVLNVLESEDVESLSNVILLLSKLIATEDTSAPVSKSVSRIWPSFVSAFSSVKVSKSDEEEKPVMTGERAKESLAATFGGVHESDSILGDDDD